MKNTCAAKTSSICLPQLLTEVKKWTLRHLNLWNMSLYDVHCKLRKLQNVTQIVHSLYGFKLKSIDQTSTTVAKTHMYYMKTVHLFAKYTTQSDIVLLQMCRRILSFKYSASVVITTSMIIRPYSSSRAWIFRKMCEIQPWHCRRSIHYNVANK